MPFHFVVLPFTFALHQAVSNREFSLAISHRIAYLPSITGPVGIDVQALLCVRLSVFESPFVIASVVIVHLAETMWNAVKPMSAVVGEFVHDVVGLEQLAELIIDWKRL